MRSRHVCPALGECTVHSTPVGNGSITCRTTYGYFKGPAAVVGSSDRGIRLFDSGTAGVALCDLRLQVFKPVGPEHQPRGEALAPHNQEPATAGEDLVRPVKWSDLNPLGWKRRSPWRKRSPPRGRCFLRTVLGNSRTACGTRGEKARQLAYLPAPVNLLPLSLFSPVAASAAGLNGLGGQAMGLAPRDAHG